MEQYLFHQYRRYPGDRDHGRTPTQHQHQFWQLDYITDGSGRFHCNDRTTSFGRGDVIIIPGRNPHCFDYGDSANSWLSIKFSSDCNAAAPPVRFAADRILQSTLAVIMEGLTPNFFHRESAIAVVNSALGVVVNYFLMQLQEEKSAPSEFMRRILQCIYERQGRYVSVAELGEAVGYSGKYAAIRFRKETGVSLKAFIDHQRGEYAAGLLRTSSASLAEIAEKLEFRDVYAFSRFFRKEFGDTLSGFRRKRLDAR